MHHFDSEEALEMPAVKGIDGAYFRCFGESDDPRVYKIHRAVPVQRDSPGDDGLIADFDSMSMQYRVQQRHDLTSFEFVKALKDPDQLRDHDRRNEEPNLILR